MSAPSIAHESPTPLPTRNSTPLNTPPTALTTQQPTPLACTACTDDLTPPYLLIDSSPICHDCFRHLFSTAIEAETSFPANWGGQPLSATRHAHILGPDLFKAYQAKTAEYACPLPLRVFCARTDPPRHSEPCGFFVGAWREAKSCVRCPQCMWYTCLRCEETFSTADARGAETDIEHECDPRRDEELEERAFWGLVRGKDWQVCPNGDCGRRVQLSEGCNHVRCVCRTHFCFVCGAVVRDGVGHWRREGGCPRFGLKDSERAIYDEEDLWDDNGDVGDEERAWGEQVAGGGMGHPAARRAFEIQMRFVLEQRRELEEREARRLDGLGHGLERGGEGVGVGVGIGVDGGAKHRGRRRGVDGGGRVGEVAGGGDAGPKRLRRRRRRSPDGHSQEHGGEQREEHHRRRRDRRLAQLEPAASGPSEQEPQRRRGFRAFLHDATEFLLFGDTPSRRR